MRSRKPSTLSEMDPTSRFVSRCSFHRCPRLTVRQKASNDKSEPDLVDEPTVTGLSTDFVEDKERSRRLRWKVDLKFLPICAFVYVSTTS